MRKEVEWSNKQQHILNNIDKNENLFYCVHPIDTPFQDWYFEIESEVNKSYNSCIKQKLVPSIITLFSEKISKMAVNTRNAILMDKVQIHFERSQKLPNHAASMPEHDYSNDKNSAKTNYTETRKKTNNGEIRFDVVMTGNRCDIYGLHTTLAQVNKNLKYPWENPDAYILTHHRAWKLRLGLLCSSFEEDQVLGTEFDIECERRLADSFLESYKLKAYSIEDEKTKQNKDLFHMKDYWLRNVCWKWEYCNTSKLSVTFHPENKNRTDQVMFLNGEKEQSEPFMPVRIDEIDNAITNIQTMTSKLKRTSTIHDDDIEYSKQTRAVINQQNETNGIKRKFFDLEDQAKPKLFSTSDEIYVYKMLLKTSPFSSNI